MDAIELSVDEVRRLQLRAQGLLGAGFRRPATTPGAGGRGAGGRVREMVRGLGAVQLDTISVLARSHELVPYARLGAVGRAKVEDAYWGDGAGFEYWAHAASVLPLEDWPLFAFRRRDLRKRGRRWHKVPEGVGEGILRRLRDEGPLTTKELGGAKSSSYWWDWSDHKIGIEWLLDIGEVVCVRRVGWRRVYDLAERAIPGELLRYEPEDPECLARLVGRAGRALAVGTAADLADYYRIRIDQVDAEAAGLVPVTVRGWRGAAWADPEALAAPPPRGRHATTLLSPFDSLVWDRARASRVFGFDHRLEAYVPKAKRVHGYFAMPLLAGGEIIGRVDPAREGRTLVARQVSFEPGAVRTARRAEAAANALATALWQAADWVGCDDVRVERTDADRSLVDAALRHAADR